MENWSSSREPVFLYNESEVTDMIYPEFIKKHEIIGIAAPSAGAGRYLEKYQASIDTLKAQGYSILETESVRNDDDRSTSAENRGEEFTSLFREDSVKMVMCAKGGDFLDECLPYVNFKVMQKKPKWVMGASDPTGILYPYTTKYDVATIYGCNASSYDAKPMLDFIKTNLEILKGKHVIQHSYPSHLAEPPYDIEQIKYDTPTQWLSSQDTIRVSGRCIGGCIDVLKDLIGTEYDGTKKFVQKYKQDGIIWYFDNFSLSAEVLYRTLLQFRYAGWFKSTKAVIIGRTLYESSETGMTYGEAITMAMGGIPVLYQADIGHTYPHMTMINGAILHLTYKDGQSSLSFELK